MTFPCPLLPNEASPHPGSPGQPSTRLCTSPDLTWHLHHGGRILQCVATCSRSLTAKTHTLSNQARQPPRPSPSSTPSFSRRAAIAEPDQPPRDLHFPCLTSDLPWRRQWLFYQAEGGRSERARQSAESAELIWPIEGRHVNGEKLVSTQ